MEHVFARCLALVPNSCSRDDVGPPAPGRRVVRAIGKPGRDAGWCVNLFSDWQLRTILTTANSNTPRHKCDPKNTTSHWH